MSPQLKMWPRLFNAPSVGFSSFVWRNQTFLSNAAVKAEVVQLYSPDHMWLTVAANHWQDVDGCRLTASVTCTDSTCFLQKRNVFYFLWYSDFSFIQTFWLCSLNLWRLFLTRLDTYVTCHFLYRLLSTCEESTSRTLLSHSNTLTCDSKSFTADWGNTDRFGDWWTPTAIKWTLQVMKDQMHNDACEGWFKLKC